MFNEAEILAIILFYDVSTEFRPALSNFEKYFFRPTLPNSTVTSKDKPFSFPTDLFGAVQDPEILLKIHIWKMQTTSP